MSSLPPRTPAALAGLVVALVAALAWLAGPGRADAAGLSVGVAGVSVAVHVDAQAPSASDPWGCGGGCNLATNTLIAGLPLPGTSTSDGTASDGATAVGDPTTTPASDPVDPNAPVAAEQLLGVVTH